VSASRPAALFVLAAAAAQTVQGCSSGAASSSPSASKVGAPVSAAATTASSAPAVTIKSFKFSPTPLTVAKGTKVTWTQTDDTIHTVTADDKTFNSGNLAMGKTFSFTVEKTVSYHCDIHQYMTAQIVVS
jgi:plastocyanin